MYKTDNVKIGRHLADLIKQHYKSDRDFCIKYLEKRDKDKCNPDDVQKMQNRICQIKKGNKGVQIEDIPVFTELLGVSAEDILSAGTSLVPAITRKTNYSVAYSRKSADWEEYIGRDDKPFLNPDEFNKTVIDYALEAGNFPLLKYLMEKEYIWFVGNNKEDFYMGFGAGTSVRRREPGNNDILDIRMKEQDDLRFRMITLAIENKTTTMLSSLRAREIPRLYTINRYMYPHKELPSSPNVTQMIESIAQSSNTVLSYFFEPFEIESTGFVSRNTYVFPYAGRVLDLLIKKQRHAESIRFLEKAIKHNKRVQKQLQELVNKSTKSTEEYFQYDVTGYYDAERIRLVVWEDYYFDRKAGFVSYHMPTLAEKTRGFITNVIDVRVSSKDSEVQFLVDELKDTYNSFVGHLKNKEKQEEKK